jgi:hypothetical protein
MVSVTPTNTCFATRANEISLFLLGALSTIAKSAFFLDCLALEDGADT